MLQHFVNENKDRSVFRKNIGRALLAAAQDPYLVEWEIDRTSRAAREQFGPEKDLAKRQAVEAAVTRYMQEHFSFVSFTVPDKAERLRLESRIFRRSVRVGSAGLGLSSPKARIRDNGLWL